MKNRFVVCLFKPDGTVPDWSGRYSWDWVERLAGQLSRHCAPAELVVVTDTTDMIWHQELDGCDVIAKPFELQARGWAAIMECFRPDVVGDRAIFMGLDTIIVDDVSRLWLTKSPLPLGAPHDPYNPEFLCNGLLTITGEFAIEVWDHWSKNWRLEIGSKRYAYNGFPFSEMIWLRQNASHRHYNLDRSLPGALLSYKAHIQGKGLKQAPPGCLAVYFHGTPKAPDVPEEWIQREWGQS